MKLFLFSRQTLGPRCDCQASCHLLGPLVSSLLISFFKVMNTFCISMFSIISHSFLNTIKHSLYYKCHYRSPRQSQVNPPLFCRGDNDSGVDGLPSLRVTRMLSATNWKALRMARGHFLQEQSFRGALKTTRSWPGKEKGENVSGGVNSWARA